MKQIQLFSQSFSPKGTSVNECIISSSVISSDLQYLDSLIVVWCCCHLRSVFTIQSPCDLAGSFYPTFVCGNRDVGGGVEGGQVDYSAKYVISWLGSRELAEVGWFKLKWKIQSGFLFFLLFYLFILFIYLGGWRTKIQWSEDRVSSIIEHNVEYFSRHIAPTYAWRILQIAAFTLPVLAKIIEQEMCIIQEVGNVDAVTVTENTWVVFLRANLLYLSGHLQILAVCFCCCCYLFIYLIIAFTVTQYTLCCRHINDFG